ncbi:MAG: CvpA family protein [Anaerolineae bacterium]|nr:CvpA family protein [Anaerolineae bacterium]
MILVDLTLVVFIGLLAFMGLRSGLIHESVTLVGLIAGLLIAGESYARFGSLLIPWLKTRGMADLGAFILLLIAVWLAVLVLGALMRGLLEGLHLGWIDNLGGMVLGLARGLFLSEVLVLVLMAMPSEGLRDTIQGSWIGGWLARLGPDLLDLVPPLLRYWNPL